ncbi:MAG: response regulator [Gammaproteobacteria bacterium]|nr:MAG: response regulator [Gammaproteobacteria bacterium]
MTETLLIVEDEARLAQLHLDYLHSNGYATYWMASGNGVVEWVRAHAPRLVLLDLMLPGCDGLDICREIRQFSQVPIIMVTARVEEIDRLLGLELGADDYICKPFSPREVVARVKAVLRRTPHKPREQRGIVQIDEAGYLARINDHRLDLTTIEFRLLTLLCQNEGRIFSRTQLMDRIYHDHRLVCDRTIDSHVKKLRKKIAQVAPDLELIHSVYGVGYKLEYRETSEVNPVD